MWHWTQQSLWYSCGTFFQFWSDRLEINALADPIEQNSDMIATNMWERNIASRIECLSNHWRCLDTLYTKNFRQKGPRPGLADALAPLSIISLLCYKLKCQGEEQQQQQNLSNVTKKYNGKKKKSIILHSKFRRIENPKPKYMTRERQERTKATKDRKKASENVLEWKKNRGTQIRNISRLVVICCFFFIYLLLAVTGFGRIRGCVTRRKIMSLPIERKCDIRLIQTGDWKTNKRRLREKRYRNEMTDLLTIDSIWRKFSLLSIFVFFYHQPSLKLNVNVCFKCSKFNI